MYERTAGGGGAPSVTPRIISVPSKVKPYEPTPESVTPASDTLGENEDGVVNEVEKYINGLYSVPAGVDTDSVDAERNKIDGQFKGYEDKLTEDYNAAKGYLADLLASGNASLDASLRSGAKGLGAARDDQLEYAGVVYERMKKYLPHQLKSAGMANMGVAQTAGIDLANKHASTRGGIEDNYAQNMLALQQAIEQQRAALQREHTANMMELENAYHTNVLTNQQNWDTALNTYDQTKETEAHTAQQDQYLTDFLSALENGIVTGKDGNDAQNYIDLLLAAGADVDVATQNQMKLTALDYFKEKTATEEQELADQQQEKLTEFETKYAALSQSDPTDYTALGNLLEDYKDKIPDASYKSYMWLLDLAKNDPQVQMDAQVTEKEKGLTQMALDAGYDSVEDYKTDVLAGEEFLTVTQGYSHGGENLKGKKVKITSAEIPNSHPYFQSTLLQVDTASAPEGTITTTNSRGRVDLMIKWNGKWYQCKVVN